MLEAVRAAAPEPRWRPRPPPGALPAPRTPAARDPADIAERIRHLGELHEAGLLTDDEFTKKKADLLAEL